MWTAEVVLGCVLAMLGRSASTLPPIQLVAVRPGNPLAEAFVDTGRVAIYVVTSSEVFRRAQGASDKCGEVGAVRKLASIIVHEEWHVRHGADQAAAYQAQLMTLRVLGADSGDRDYLAVL